MSREFGRYEVGFFHDQIRNCAEDAAESGNEITRLYGQLLAAMVTPAIGISGLEECDNGVDYPIEETIIHLPTMRAALNKIAEYVEPFKRVADNARSAAIRELAEKSKA